VDFSFSDEQQAIRELARRIFADHVSHERLRELETSGEWFDGALWGELARANLTALVLPEEVGGSGCGLIEASLVLQEAGRHLAPVPLLPTLLLGGLPIAHFGTPEQRARWLAPVTGDEGVLTAALEEPASHAPSRPRTRARRDGDTWRLEGEKVGVPAAHLARAVLVPARTDGDGVGVFVVAPDAAGVKLERQVTTNREPHARLQLDGARVTRNALLGDPSTGATLVEWIVERATLGLCALQLGVCEEALRRTAEYTSQRKQFGRAIATFQGVALRAADAFIDVEAMRATLWQAAWRLNEGRPASLAVASAKWWACVGGQRVTHTAQHLHGGIGADVEYPIHRFLLRSRQLELSLGGATRQLARIGSLLAHPPQGEA
jgi:alkylation response protein AidB-like acyl-CoA dehydrogenase